MSQPQVLTLKQLLVVGAALFVAQMCFGGFSVVGKIATSLMNPIVFSFLREGLSAPILLAAAVIVERPSPDPRDSGWFFALGIVGIFGTQLFYILGISISGAIVGSIMQPSIPVWTTLICMIFRLEPPSVLKILGILLSVGGAVTMVVGGDTKTTNYTGVLFFVGNTFCSGVYIVLQKPVLKKYGPLTVTAIAYLIASFFMGSSLLYYVFTDQYVWEFQIDKVLWPVLYAVFFPTVIAYALVSYANSKIDASIVSAANTLQPLAATTLACIFLHEQLVWRHGLGAGLIISGLFCVSFDKYRATKQQKALQMKLSEQYGEDNVSFYPAMPSMSVNGDMHTDGDEDYEGQRRPLLGVSQTGDDIELIAT